MGFWWSQWLVEFGNAAGAIATSSSIVIGSTQCTKGFSTTKYETYWEIFLFSHIMMLSIITFSKVTTFTWFCQIALQTMIHRRAKSRDSHHTPKTYRFITYQTSTALECHHIHRWLQWTSILPDQHYWSLERNMARYHPRYTHVQWRSESSPDFFFLDMVRRLCSTRMRQSSHLLW